MRLSNEKYFIGVDEIKEKLNVIIRLLQQQQEGTIVVCPECGRKEGQQHKNYCTFFGLVEVTKAVRPE